MSFWKDKIDVIQRSGKLEKERQLRKEVSRLKQNTLTDDEKNANC